MPAQVTYRIKSGVRRAKLYQLAGHTTALVEVFTIDEDPLGTIEVAISDLRSPKTEIDLVTDPNAWYRYKRLENAVFRGIKLPIIEVYRVDGGIPIEDVKVVW